jgi:N-hydroxyarylamine O-acetyltransferase
MGLPRETVSPRTHLFLKVTIDGRDWLADFGVGSKSLTAPIRFVLDVEQETPHDIRRLVHENGRFYHQAWQGDSWFDAYEFTGEPMPFVDQHTGNWLVSTLPGSFFRTNTLSTIARPDGVRAVYHNGDFTVRRGADLLEERTMGSNEEALSVIRTEFGVELPDGVEIWAPEQSELKKVIPI